MVNTGEAIQLEQKMITDVFCFSPVVVTTFKAIAEFVHECFLTNNSLKATFV